MLPTNIDTKYVKTYTRRPEQKPVADLRAADCETPKQWAQWARERREYEDPYGPIGGRY